VVTSLLNHPLNGAAFAGITNSFSYNKRLQPVNMSATAPNQTVFSIGYDFHAGNGTAGTGTDNGNVWNLYNFRDRTRDQSFNYDALNRLTSAQNAGTNCAATTANGKTEYWGNNYGYDAWGNLTAKSVTKCSAENMSLTALANNQLSGYGYDAAGNMTSDPTDAVSATYDPENRIATAAKTGATTNYVYDADGNRVKKSTGSTGTLYWYMTPGIVAESDLAGNLKSEYVFFNGERVARRDYPSGSVAYYFSDHLKTASVITDSAGNIKSESDYYPWGGELQFVNNDSNHYRFTGKERDLESGLDYFQARYLSNAMGRFTSPDPIHFQAAMLSDPQQFNLYAYVRNNPLTLIDPTGESIELTGDKEQRKKELQALRQAAGPQGGSYLYENSVTTTDSNGNLTTKYYVGVLTNGPDGKGPAFGNINNVSEALGNIISDSRVAQLSVVPSGTTVTNNLGTTKTIGPIRESPGAPDTLPGATYIGQNGQWHVTLLDTDSTPPGQLPPNYMSNGKPGAVDSGILAGHEFGHLRYEWGGSWRHILDSTDASAIRLENDVRKLHDPDAATRREH
jgi:RHS repeat-associated protein